MFRLASLWILLLLGGCASLATTIAEPRTQSTLSGRQAANIDRGLADLGVRTMSLTAQAGNRIVYRDVPPADYHLDYTYQRRDDSVRIRFALADREAPRPVAAAGTIVYLHGWNDDHRTMMLWALALAKQGYRGIVPDLRNHGASDRAPAGFGLREAQDIVDLLAALRREGDMQHPVMLFGVSYGAATAVFAAQQPKTGVTAVIAMEPMVNAGGAVRSAVASLRDGRATTWRGRLLAWIARHRYRQASVDRAIASANARLGLDLDAIDITPVLRDGGPCTLVLQGGADTFLDPARARALGEAPRVRYVELPVENHYTLPARVDLLGEPLAGWLATADDCRPFAAPTESAPPASPATSAPPPR